VIIITLFVPLTGCKENVLPKPNAQLRLEYSRPEMGEMRTEKFFFEYNDRALLKHKNSGSLTLQYPEMKGEIFINYKAVKGDIEKLISDARRFSYEHSTKADGIAEQPFINKENNVYGMFYDVTGNAASQAQFYVTDSTQHFVTGSLYFFTKPNYDSIYPAAAYLRNDMRGIMETLRWED